MSFSAFTKTGVPCYVLVCRINLYVFFERTRHGLDLADLRLVASDLSRVLSFGMG